MAHARSTKCKTLDDQIAGLLHNGQAPGAHHLIIATLGPGLRGYLRAKTGSEVHAEQLYDELRDALWDHLPDFAEKLGRIAPGYDRPFSVRAWLYRSAHNRFLSWRERCSRDNLPLPSYADQLVRTLAPGPSTLARYNQIIARIKQELPEAEIDVFILRTERELSFAEIGETLGITEGTARVRFHRARQGIRELLERIDQE